MSARDSAFGVLNEGGDVEFEWVGLPDLCGGRFEQEAAGLLGDVWPSDEDSK